MQLERIEVKTRDNYRGAQEPAAFGWRNHDYEVEEILDRWYEGYFDSTRVPLRYFRVKAKNGDIFTLRHNELFAAWSLLVPARHRETEHPS